MEREREIEENEKDESFKEKIFTGLRRSLARERFMLSALQATARGGAKVVSTLAEPLVGRERATIKPKGVGKVLYGKEDITPLTQSAEELRSKAKEKGLEGTGWQLGATALPVAGVALDITPLGGEKAALKKIIKVTTGKQAVKMIEKLGLKYSDDLAKKLINTKTTKEAKSLIEEAKKGVKTLASNSKPLQEGGSLIQEARKYKSWEDFREGLRKNPELFKQVREQFAKYEKIPKGELGSDTNAVRMKNNPFEDAFNKSQPLQEGGVKTAVKVEPKIVKKAVEVKKPVTVEPTEATILSTPRKLVTGGEKILRKSGEGGKKLAKTMEKQRVDEDLLRGKYTFRIKEALRGLSKKERINVGEVLEGKAKPGSAKEAGAMKTIENWLAKVGKRAEDEGFEILTPTAEGLEKVPFKPRKNYFPRVYNFDKLAKGKQREKALTHLVETGQARNKAEAVRLLDNFIKGNAERKAGNIEFARTLDLPGYEKDPLVALQRYAQSVSKRFTEAAHFGKKDENVAELIGRIAEDSGDYMEAQRIFDFQTGGYDKSKVISVITKANVATKLSLSAIINATQSTNTLTKGGIIRATKSMFKSFTKKGRDYAEIAGVYDDMILKQESGFDLDKITKVVLYPFQKVEHFNRRVAALTGKEKALQLAKKLKIDPDNAYVIRQLKTLGIEPKKLLTGKLTDDDLYRAANKMSEITQFKVGPLDVPPSWKTKTGRLLTQFKSFNFMQTKFVRDEILKEASKGNLAPLVRFISIAPIASALAYKMRNIVTGRDEKDERKGALDLRDWDRYLRVIGTFPTDILSQGQFIGKTFKSDFLTPLQKYTRLGSSILGPTAGEAGKLIAGLEDTQRKKERNLEMRSAIGKGKAKEQDEQLLLKRQAVEKVPFIGQAIKNKRYAFPVSDKTPEEKKVTAGYYDWMDEVRKLPSGSPEEKKMIQEKISGLPQEERDRLIGMLRGTGFDTAGIKISESTIKALELHDKMKTLKGADLKKAFIDLAKSVEDEDEFNAVIRNVERYQKNDLAEKKGLGERFMDKDLNDRAKVLIEKTNDMSKEEMLKFFIDIDKAGVLTDNLKEEFVKLKKEPVAAVKAMQITKKRTILGKLKDKFASSKTITYKRLYESDLGKPPDISGVKALQAPERWEKGEGSYYNPMDASQTKANPDGIGAYGRKVGKGSIAFGNRKFHDELKKGKIIYVKIKELENVETPYGDGVFRIDDTMNERYSDSNNIDFF